MTACIALLRCRLRFITPRGHDRRNFCSITYLTEMPGVSKIKYLEACLGGLPYTSAGSSTVHHPPGSCQAKFLFYLLTLHRQS